MHNFYGSELKGFKAWIGAGQQKIFFNSDLATSDLHNDKSKSRLDMLLLLAVLIAGYIISIARKCSYECLL